MIDPWCIRIVAVGLIENMNLVKYNKNKLQRTFIYSAANRNKNKVH